MGGAVSTGNNNDDLIDNLLGSDYIRTPTVERVFRAVDRAEYFLPDTRSHAYKDLAWKRGNLHLSAPCIYSEVMEGLCLSPGLSFLNLGSGTGYLSTMVGLVLGSSGINHGIEIHEDVVQYANKKLEIFKRYSGAVDEFDFCEPKYIQGNCLCLSSDTRLYDRIYCGAACPEPYETYIKHLLKVGGILVMPLNDQLLQIKRISETTWDVRSLLLVSFATLIQPCDGNKDFIRMIELNPRSLQEMCRTVIRNILRDNITKECPNLKKTNPTPKKVPKKKRTLRRLVVPLFDTSDDSSDDEFFVRSRHAPRRENGEDEGAEEDNNDNEPTVQVREMMLNYVLDRIRDRRNNVLSQRQNRNNNNQPQDGNESDNNSDSKTEGAVVAESNDGCATEGEAAGSEVSVKSEVTAVIEYNPGSGEEENHGTSSTKFDEDNHNKEDDENALQTQPEASTSKSNGKHKRASQRAEINMEEILTEEIQSETAAAVQQEAVEAKKKTNREKFDSGLGEEIIEAPSSESPDRSDSDNQMEVESNESTEELDEEERGSKRGSKDEAPGTKWRRVTLSPNRCLSGSSTENDTTQDESRSALDEIRVIPSPYTAHMKRKIQELPLPSILKNYLNFYREF